MLETCALGGCVGLFVMGFLNAKIVYRLRLRWVGWEVREERDNPWFFRAILVSPLHRQRFGFK
jgi:hypothetical protein